MVLNPVEIFEVLLLVVSKSCQNYLIEMLFLCDAQISLGKSCQGGQEEFWPIH